MVTLPSGLQYKILKAGDGKKPTVDDTVVCNYRGTLLDGTEFDSSYKRNRPTTFRGQGSDQGLERGASAHARRIQVAALRSLRSRLRRARRAKGGIGPNATLVFEVELLSIQDKSEASAATRSRCRPRGGMPG